MDLERSQRRIRGVNGEIYSSQSDGMQCPCFSIEVIKVAQLCPSPVSEWVITDGRQRRNQSVSTIPTEGRGKGLMFPLRKELVPRHKAE